MLRRRRQEAGSLSPQDGKQVKSQGSFSTQDTPHCVIPEQGSKESDTQHAGALCPDIYTTLGSWEPTMGQGGRGKRAVGLCGQQRRLKTSDSGAQDCLPLTGAPSLSGAPSSTARSRTLDWQESAPGTVTPLTPPTPTLPGRGRLSLLSARCPPAPGLGADCHLPRLSTSRQVLALSVTPGLWQPGPATSVPDQPCYTLATCLATSPAVPSPPPRLTLLPGRKASP